MLVTKVLMEIPSPVSILEAAEGEEKRLLLPFSFSEIKSDLFSRRKIEIDTTKDWTIIFRRVGQRKNFEYQWRTQKIKKKEVIVNPTREKPKDIGTFS